LVLSLLVVLVSGAGCALLPNSNDVKIEAIQAKVDALAVMTREQSVRAATTEAVMLKLAEKGEGVIPDTVAHVEDGSTVGWASAKRCIRDEANKPLLTPDGIAQFETTTAIGKSKSSREFANITKGTIKLAGVGFDLQTGQLVPSSILEGVVVHIEGTGGDSTVNSEWASVWGNAVAAEKTAILAGMAQLATSRGAAYAVKVTASANGMSQIVTSLGTITGQILSAMVIPTTPQLAASGVTSLVQAVLRQSDGTTQTVVGADTPAGQVATALTAAATSP